MIGQRGRLLLRNNKVTTSLTYNTMLDEFLMVHKLLATTINRTLERRRLINNMYLHSTKLIQPVNSGVLICTLLQGFRFFWRI